MDKVKPHMSNTDAKEKGQAEDWHGNERADALGRRAAPSFWEDEAKLFKS